MKVQFLTRVTWYDLTFAEGEIVDLDNGIANRLLRAGTIVPAPETVKENEVIESEETNGDQDITASEDGGVSKSLNDSVSKDAPKRRTNGRNK